MKKFTPGVNFKEKSKRKKKRFKKNSKREREKLKHQKILEEF